MNEERRGLGAKVCMIVSAPYKRTAPLSNDSSYYIVICLALPSYPLFSLFTFSIYSQFIVFLVSYHFDLSGFSTDVSRWPAEVLLIITLDCFATFFESRLLFAHTREQVAQMLVFYEMGDYRFENSPTGFSIAKFKISFKTCNMFDCYLNLLDLF